MTVSPPAESPAPNNNTGISYDLGCLALLVGLLFFFNLGNTSLANPDEGRYAEIPREMLASGDWVTPRLNGVNYFEKPPLVYWLIAGSQIIFGRNEWAIRAVPALFALGGVLLTYAAARALRGRLAGLLSASVLATSLIYFGIARIVILDMTVSVLMSAALFCFILGVREAPGSRRRWLFYALYTSMALATLTKGLIGFLVTGAVMFLWLLVFNQWRRLLPLYLPTGVVLFLGIASPWHVLAALQNPTWAHRYFVYEHWQRFFENVASRPGPWYYYIGIVLAGLIPWVGFLWPALRDGVRGGWAAREKNADTWFLVTWVGFIFFFFSVNHSKLPPYILPVFPALAVLIGTWLAQRWTESDAAQLRTGFRIFSSVCGLLSLALCAIVFLPQAQAKAHLQPAQALLLRPYTLGLAVVLILGGGLVPWLAKTRRTSAALIALTTTMAVFYLLVTFAQPLFQKAGTKDLALIVRGRAQPGDRVVHYHDFFHDFTFYAERVVDVVAAKGEIELEEDPAAIAGDRFMDDAEFRRRWAGPVRIWVVAQKDATAKLFADPSFRYYLLDESRSHCLFSNQP